MTRFMSAAGISDYGALYAWSIEQPEAFWPLVWKFCDVIGSDWSRVLVGRERMAPPDPALGPRWFEGAQLNFAENLLRFDDDGPAIVSWNETGPVRNVSYRELNVEVHAFAAALRASGVGAGDRVAGFMPNIPEAVIAMLGAARWGTGDLEV